MNKRSIGLILLGVGLVLFFKHFPIELSFLPNKEILPPLALAVFGVYLMTRKNYQVGLAASYLGITYLLYYAGIENAKVYVESDYYWSTIIIVLGLGFLIQSRFQK